MATRKHNPPAEKPGSTTVPDLIRKCIEAERRRLQKASSVLASMEFSVNHEADHVDPGDVASVARDLVDKAVNALDVVELEKCAERRRLSQH